jgi:hypothetical protein
VTSKNSLFQTPWPPRAILKHLHIVVGLQNETMCRAHTFKDELCRMPEVSEEPDIAARRAQQKSDRILCVVRDREGFNHNIAYFEASAGAEYSAVEFCLQLLLHGFLRQPVAIDGDVKLLTKNLQPGGVIRMLVCEQHTVQVFRRATDACKALPDLAKTEPRVDQQPGLVCLAVGAIPGGTAAKNCEIYRHRQTLNSRRAQGNSFPDPGAVPGDPSGLWICRESPKTMPATMVRLPKS